MKLLLFTAILCVNSLGDICEKFGHCRILAATEKAEYLAVSFLMDDSSLHPCVCLLVV